MTRLAFLCRFWQYEAFTRAICVRNNDMKLSYSSHLPQLCPLQSRDESESPVSIQHNSVPFSKASRRNNTIAARQRSAQLSVETLLAHVQQLSVVWRQVWAFPIGCRPKPVSQP